MNSLTAQYYDWFHKRVTGEVFSLGSAKDLLFDLLSDLTDRRGLRQEFEGIDSDVQEEILEAWLQIIRKYV